jgi:hypothetical protein
LRATKKKEPVNRDDSLFGLLASYKQFITYFRLLINEKAELISVQMTANPKNWNAIDAELFAEYRPMRRLELGCSKLSVKYLPPEIIIRVMGPMLGIKVPSEKASVENRLDDKGYFLLEIPVKYKDNIIEGISRILSFTPQKKYELLEKSLTISQE